MTLPGVRVTSVRRTVRVAAVLVAGQALLCLVIGIVTFGGRDEPDPRPRAAEPQLAGPPVVVPAATPTLRVRVKSSTRGVAEPASTERQAAPPTPAVERTSASRGFSPPRTASLPARSKPPSSERPVLPPPDPETEDGLPIPVVDEPCDVEGATGRTIDDEVVRCERGPDQELRWRLG